MTTRTAITAALLTAGLLAGCSAGDDSDDAATSPQDVGAELGCDSFTEEDTEELFVRSLYDCDGETRVYFFNDSDARDDWREIAEEVGGVVLEEGDAWVQVKN